MSRFFFERYFSFAAVMMFGALVLALEYAETVGGDLVCVAVYIVGRLAILPFERSVAREGGEDA